jgi:hypothetical protein
LNRAKKTFGKGRNVKLPLRLIKHHSMKMHWEGGSIASTLDGAEWSASGLGYLIFDTHWTGGGVGSRAGLDAVVN